ncbi:ribosome maturation factor RimP [Labilithrix luteola]|nr:ribosome maturation factor RimP [Labilithrix luteola]
MQPISSHNPAALQGVDREQLLAVIEPVARAHGAEVVDVELKNENGWVLRVFVERLGASAEKLSTKDAAVDLELCAGIARDLSPALDVDDPIPGRYNLEVSSPGIERPLKKEADYVRFAGEKAKLKLREAVGGQKVLVGRLGPVSAGKVAVDDGRKTYDVPLDDIVTARLVFEFGPAPKPGTSKGGSSKSAKKKRKP